ncbi:MAG: BolA family transcriptional regulator [Betaproteobacteria bacterium]|nr:BolA family transcriptional regulator [Betaproteobacteria bacterium]MBI2508735.1 BolA family transcriptional regulator [Betaproteobacteria bacterium]
MSVTERIQEKLAVLAPESLEILDESDKHAGHEGARAGGGHYRLVIVSREFAGQSVQRRHRMVYDALGPMMHNEIHALAIKARAPGEN